MITRAKGTGRRLGLSHCLQQPLAREQGRGINGAQVPGLTIAHFDASADR